MADVFLPLRDEKTLKLLQQAVDVAYIKAALDGKPYAEDLRLLGQYLTGVSVDELPDRPSQDGKAVVKCWFSLDELAAMQQAVEEKANSTAFGKHAEWRRFAALGDLLARTIARFR